MLTYKMSVSIVRKNKLNQYDGMTQLEYYRDLEKHAENLISSQDFETYSFNMNQWSYYTRFSAWDHDNPLDSIVVLYELAHYKDK